jgi:hypothetical protein
LTLFTWTQPDNSHFISDYSIWQEAFLSRRRLHLHQNQQCKVSKVSNQNSTIRHNNLHAEAAVEVGSSLEAEVALELDAVVVVDRVIPTLNHSAIISSVQHLVKDLGVLRLEKGVMPHLRGQPHKETLIPRR